MVFTWDEGVYVCVGEGVLSHREMLETSRGAAVDAARFSPVRWQTCDHLCAKPMHGRQQRTDGTVHVHIPIVITELCIEAALCNLAIRKVWELSARCEELRFGLGVGKVTTP